MKRLFGLIALTVIVGSCGNQSKDLDNQEANDSASVVSVNANGLEIEIISEGDGEPLKNGDIVSVHYTGKLKSNGKVFDSSYDVGSPFEFPLGKGRVIQGWDEGIAQLSVGTKAVLTIPANLAYGDKDNGPIPANSDLIFEVEILGVKPAPKPIVHEVFDIADAELIETNSGLKCYIMEPGDGDQIMAGNEVKVHYYGYLTSTNEKFDSSFERGQPISVNVGARQVIPGWEEGLALLKKGTKAKLIIPSHLAYGEQGIPGVIPPNSELAFDVQIVGVK